MRTMLFLVFLLYLVSAAPVDNDETHIHEENTFQNHRDPKIFDGIWRSLVGKITQTVDTGSTTTVATTTYRSTTTATTTTLGSTTTATTTSAPTTPKPPPGPPHAVYTEAVDACIYGYTDEEIQDISLKECKQRCSSSTDFQCNSIDYLDTPNKFNKKRCFLSKDTKATQPSAYKDPCTGDYATAIYLEKNPCLYPCCINHNDCKRFDRSCESSLHPQCEYCDANGPEVGWCRRGCNQENDKCPDGFVCEGNHNCVSVGPYEMSSSDGAALHQSSRMGQYIRIGDFKEDFPVFKKGEDYLYVEEGFWTVGDNYRSSTEEWIFHKDRNPTPGFPPLVGWEYKNDGWHPDTTLTVVNIDVDKTQSVYYRVSSSGDADKHQSDSMTDYYPTGERVNNFPVYRRRDQYLYVSSEGIWTVGTTVDGTTPSLQHPTKPATNEPPVSGWQYSKTDGEWHKDSTLEVVAFHL